MRREILFMAPDYYGFNEVVYDGFVNYGNGNVQNIVLNESYKYKNLLERFENFFSKLFFNKNLKTIKAQKELTARLENLQYTDFIIINRHDLLTVAQLQILKQKTSNLFCILWDSLQKIPQQENNLNVFDKVFSFDPQDCLENGFLKIDNFYFIKYSKPSTPKYKVSYLGTIDNRTETLIKFFEYFNRKNIPSFAKLYIYKSELSKVKTVLPENIQFFHQIIPFRESHQIYIESEIILDLVHEHQRGVSFRPFEALGLRKKLITNNPEILKYDFYNPSNILYINTSEDISIPESFIESEYEDVNETIYEKYYIRNWVSKILSYHES